MQVEVLERIRAVAGAAWDALVPADDPFLAHPFLAALEDSGSVGPPETGWQVRHLLLREGGEVVGAMPLYEKQHSFGEFVFDWPWADACARAGIPYYPKLVAAVPFTPVAGPRVLCLPGADPSQVTSHLLAAADALAQARGATGLHVLFCPEAMQRQLAGAGFVPRSTMQFHWRRQEGWGCFEDFLGSLRAPARKQLRRERERARAHGLSLSVHAGDALNDDQWRALADFYLLTLADKGGAAYLTDDFFARLRATMAERVVAALAHRGDEPVAGALFLRRGAALFGRYWGAREPLDCLHFELCYHLPVEWGLAHGIERIEAGAQGAHKHKRGFLPTACFSAHALYHPGLRAAVARACAEEACLQASAMEELRAHTPYQRG